MDKSTFENNFPHFAYQKEDEIQSWTNQRTLQERTFNTETSKDLKLDMSAWPVGYYAVVLKTQDPSGTPIEVKKTFRLYDREQQLITESYFRLAPTVSSAISARRNRTNFPWKYSWFYPFTIGEGATKENSNQQMAAYRQMAYRKYSHPGIGSWEFALSYGFCEAQSILYLERDDFRSLEQQRIEN